MSALCGPSTWRVYGAVVDLGDRWCFRCRRRVAFTGSLEGEAWPTWYEPVWIVRCAARHQDGDLFPGRTRGAT